MLNVGCIACTLLTSMDLHFSLLSIHIAPDIMVNWLALLHHIQKVSGSNLGPLTSYPD
jgi:hypothetical protein